MRQPLFRNYGAAGAPLEVKMKNWEVFLKGRTDCSCGKIHTCPIEKIIIEKGAVKAVPKEIINGNYQHVLVVSDINTEKAAGTYVKEQLELSKISYNSYIFQDEELVPDETAIGALLVGVPLNCDLILAVGAGTINDLCRYVGHRLGIDYFVVGTAPSMDGYASNVSPLIIGHLKTTYEIGCAKIIFGDLDILAQAPLSMIQAGVGDILGKYVCLMDWKLAHLVTGEYHCEYVEGLVQEALETVAANAGKTMERDPEAIASVMDALVLTGIAMSYVGISRPASGSEHHLSHYWEMMALLHGDPDAFHGTKVGVATVLTLDMYHRLPQYLKKLEAFQAAECENRTGENTMSEKCMEIPQIAQTIDCEIYNKESWEQNILEKYGPSAPGVLELEEKVQKNSPENVRRRMEQAAKMIPEICSMVETLPQAEEIKELLERMGAPFFPEQIQVRAERVKDSILYAKELRNRYGLLQLYYDLHVLEKEAEQMSRQK